MQKAVIVETKKEFQRPDGSTLRFDRNACVLVNVKGMPIGSRVLGFVTHELRARNLMKVRAFQDASQSPLQLVWSSLTESSTTMHTHTSATKQRCASCRCCPCLPA